MIEHKIIDGKHTFANAYNGPREPRKHRRGVKAVEWGFSDLDREFDSLVAASLLRAMEEGGRRITILDIGSGDAGLARNFLEAPELSRRTRTLLRKHPQLEIEIIGLTDAPSIDMLFHDLPLEINECELSEADRRVNRQISVRNIAYTLTRTQTLEGFLQSEAVKVDKLDRIFATNSLRYLSPNVFQEVAETGVRYLRSGGSFIAYYWGGNLPWAYWGHNDGFNTNAPSGSEVYRFVSVLNGHIMNPLPEQRLAKDILSRYKDYERLIKKAWRFYKGEKELKGAPKNIGLPALEEEDIQRAELQAESELPYLKQQANHELKGIQPNLPFEGAYVKIGDKSPIEYSLLEADQRQLLDSTQSLKLERLADLTLIPAYGRYERRWRLRNLRQKRAIIKSIPGVKLRWTHRYEANGGGFVLLKE